MPSTVVRRYAYRPHRAALDVEFVGGRVYRYFGVPADIAEQMRAWRSKGAFLNRKVLGRYDFARLPGWEGEDAAAEPAPRSSLDGMSPPPCGQLSTKGFPMSQTNDSNGRQAQQNQSQSQTQGGTDSPRRTDGPFVDQTERAGAGLHPGSDRDDYGAPENESGRVGDRQYAQERQEPGQVERGDGGTDTGAPAGYGDRGQGGAAPGQEEQRTPGQPRRDEQQGTYSPDSEHARQAAQPEAGNDRRG
jgi:hypothetical protein